ncbi:MAG TPA: hypothetical protein EYQ48_02840 [Candidatus Lambdaproteobacteria bacterium]|nr:hypothetical protein [Candidatus Lambdaproteobacteria bacterium]
MKIILIYYLLITLSIIINSCSESYKEEYSSKVSIVLAEVTVVPSTTTDATPDYTFSSNIAGYITHGGSCSSSTTSAISGNNTITLASLSDGTYSDCTITVTNQKLDLKSSLTITSFTVDTTAPTIEEVTAVTTPTHDFTPDYTFSSTEAGTITYGGSCSSSDTSAISDNNTITLASLSERTYSDCTITVTDSAGNISNSLTLTSFFVDGQMGGSKQGKELSLTATKVVSTFVGSTRIINCAALYKFKYPFDITTDGTNLYVVDTDCHTIKQIVIDNGTVTILAGTGSSGSANGVGTLASFNQPKGITTDGTNLYVADSFNHLIRQIGIDNRSVTTLAGSGFGTSDGIGTLARVRRPYGITTDGTNLYVADTNNHTIRQIGIDNRSVTTLAGTVGSSGSANGVGTAASFFFPMGITTDGTNLYVADKDNDLIRQIGIDNRSVTTLAGTVGSPGSANGVGTAASFYGPTGITTDGTNLYVAEHDNHLIRQIVISTGEVTTLAGRSSGGGSAIDDNGTAARFNNPAGITTDGIDLYVIEKSNHRLRKID